MTKPAIIMQYRLLRNNKESGPYTKAQLEEMGLKPYDLLWMEGRGGAWLYASEIDDLKSIAPAVEEQPYDRFYKGKEKQTASINTTKQTTSFNGNHTNTATATVKQPKPRFRISGDKVVMIDNTALQQPKPVQEALSAVNKAPQTTTTAAAKPAAKQEIGAHIQAVGLGWEDMYTDWKEKETIEQVAEEKPAPVKRQTMEEVKQRFEEAKLKQLNNNRHKTTGAGKQNMMAAVAILVLVIGGYAGYKMNKSSGDGSRATQEAPAVEKAEILTNGDARQPESTTGDANTGSAATPQSSNNNSEEIKSSLNNASNNTPVAEEREAKIANNKKEETGAPVKNTTQKTDTEAAKKKIQQEQPGKSKQEIAATQQTKDNNTDYDIKRTTVPVGEHTPTATQPNVVKQPAAPSKKINDYITVSRLGGSDNNGSVQNVLLAVKNVTDFPIDLAVIDIQYFGANGRFQKGETMYVKNISAGNTINVRIPDGRTARSINYKVSLVSSEQKTLYLVGE